MKSLSLQHKSSFQTSRRVESRSKSNFLCALAFRRNSIRFSSLIAALATFCASSRLRTINKRILTSCQPKNSDCSLTCVQLRCALLGYHQFVEADLGDVLAPKIYQVSFGRECKILYQFVAMNSPGSRECSLFWFALLLMTAKKKTFIFSTPSICIYLSRRDY